MSAVEGGQRWTRGLDWLAARFRRPRKGLVILDDFFPDLRTGFRIAEFNAYLERLPETEVWSTCPGFKRVIRTYEAQFPQLRNRVHRYSSRPLKRASLAYLDFLNNAHLFLDDLHEAELPFLMTLYPGGGLGLNEAESDAKLDRVMSSLLLRQVVTTQPVTTAYLRDRYPGGPPVTEIYGMVTHPRYFSSLPPRDFHGEGRTLFRACFVAEKYMPHGENKGFPEFLEAVRRLKDLPETTLEFHVVGSFRPEDAGDLAGRIRFHGALPAPALMEHLLRMDAILSPNRPFLLHPGNFDGFPTGSCMEASLCGVAMLVTDPLEQNRQFEDGAEILILPASGEAFAAALSDLVEHPGKAAMIGRSGQTKCRALLSPEIQIGKRLALIEGALA